jgi:hypothetical protein
MNIVAALSLGLAMPAIAAYPVRRDRTGIDICAGFREAVKPRPR